MWYVKYRNNPKYGWRPIRFAWTSASSFEVACLKARMLYDSGWEEIHLTTKKATKKGRLVR